MDIALDYYRIFEAVARHRSFTRAAEALVNSQPNLTRAVHNLEAELGCRLFLRSSRGVELTPEGEALYAHVTAAMEQLRAGEAELQRQRELRSGMVSIACSETALHAVLLQVLSRFHRENPAIRLRVSNQSAPEAIAYLSVVAQAIRQSFPALCLGVLVNWDGVAALAVAAYGRENVVGVLMPDGIQPDIDYSNGLVEFLNLRHYVFNIQGGTSGILGEMERLGMQPSRQTRVNLPSRMRMLTLYAVAQSEEGGIVLNTSNLSEDWVGYCTVYGDAAGAFSPLGMYTTEEVIALGAELGLPEKFLIKPPSDGLTGLTDEDNLGFSYHAVNEYVRKGVADPAVKEKIDRLHRASRFKFQLMPVYHNGLSMVLTDETDYYK